MELRLPDIPTHRRDNGQFDKGHKPWNYELQGIVIGGEKTQYKKGNLPHNTRHDGAISRRLHKRSGVYYTYIRVAKAKWELLNRHIWKLHYGNIPKGHCVWHKDGNPDNNNITNLECISRAENLKRNNDREKAKKKMLKNWRAEKLRYSCGLPLQTKLLNRVKILNLTNN